MYQQKQQGMSPITVLLMMSIAAFFLMVILKLVPHYMDYNTLKTVYSNTASQKGSKDLSDSAIQRTLDKKLTVNNVRTFSLNESGYIDTGVGVIGFDYQIKEHMFANIDVVLTFSYEHELE